MKDYDLGTATIEELMDELSSRGLSVVIAAHNSKTDRLEDWTYMHRGSHMICLALAQSMTKNLERHIAAIEAGWAEE